MTVLRAPWQERRRKVGEASLEHESPNRQHERKTAAFAYSCTKRRCEQHRFFLFPNGLVSFGVEGTVTAARTLLQTGRWKYHVLPAATRLCCCDACFSSMAEL